MHPTIKVSAFPVQQKRRVHFFTLDFFTTSANFGIHSDVHCHGYTAWDPVEQAVIISIEGTDGQLQMTDEILSFFRHKVAFFDNGFLFKYFHDAFFYLWNGGLEQQVRTLKYQYPQFKIYVTGHSLGASIASIAASYLVKWNMWTAENVRLVTFGQPRTGDYDFATWHDATVSCYTQELENGRVQCF
ncbi:unnamed protein product [Cylicostephanus goldi]|uniref:Fungal lipase-type domain-containing protein n=1 Tax=Cylicostephanus goldi TaxID=71465 RepID=A0A3P7QIY3_CYLGO|nr:unnamed protein product [Cylicostephanus goldi]